MDCVDRGSIQEMHIARRVIVQGRVQGVGFRPFIFSLAKEYCVSGTVQNNMDGVIIHAEAKEAQLKEFIQSINNKKPRLAKIYKVIEAEAPFQGYSNFSIIPSERSGKSSLVIPVDAATCPDCLKEMLDPTNRRYFYPFTNCTQCGPRYTIIRALPYDRPYTSMDDFKMCDECLEEYENPLDRRHHAQPNACPKCGPSYGIYDMNRNEIKGNVIKTVCDFLEKGKILAIKGIGGYHLVCNAQDEEAVLKLRVRKNRPTKPLAIMAKNQSSAKEICEIPIETIPLLESFEAPIVLLNKKASNQISSQIAPGLNTIGIMFPYAPIHFLLFENSNLNYLVMTSANPSGLPMLYRDEEAFEYLEGIADYVVSHNRPILHPIDDSVVQWMFGKPYFIRRARGYVPEPTIALKDVDGVIALGSQQKNTFSIGRNEQIFVGPHIGDLGSEEVLEHYRNEMAHLSEWMGIKHNMSVVDLHPQFSTREIMKESNSEIIEVQHHHAHMVSCMAEHNMLGQKGIGIILDGTGYGLDKNIWGFEILYGNEEGFERKAHLQYTPLPGGEKSIHDTWKNAVGMLIHLFKQEGLELSNGLFPDKNQEIKVIEQMIHKQVNAPMAGTCGRLFDSISAILGICEKPTYDGEAAVLLGSLADLSLVNQIKPYSYEILKEDGMFLFSFKNMIREIIYDKKTGEQLTLIATRFHQTLVEAIVETINLVREECPTNDVFCSGGSFHNEYLSIGINELLNRENTQVYFHHQFPTNDGGISFGQLYVGASKRKRRD